MVDRRTFTTLLLGGIAAPKMSLARDSNAKNVFYASLGPELTLYSVDVDGTALVKRDTISTPANIQYAWPHPSKQYLYVVSSNGGPGSAGVAGNKHFANAFRIDPATGALTPHGAPLALPSRPIHASVDMAGEYLLTAYNDPSGVSVHRIGKDGMLGERIEQPNALDTGKYAHQIRATPDNRQVILVTRGNNAPTDNPKDPGSIKSFSFKDGVLTNLAAVQPADGMNFGPRHLDFHPTQPWVYVSIESQNKLHGYKLDPATGLSREPLFVKETLSDPKTNLRQAAGPIHVHPNGRFVYLTNRAFWLTDFEGRKVFAGGENSVAVFTIDQTTGEPTLIQNADGHANYLRTFGIDQDGKILLTASVWPMPVREGNGVTMMPAAISMFAIGSDGKLEFVRKYDIDASEQKQQFWAGMVTLS
ncbi:MAG: lactonase family protein [Alphaproteobacteria bacterium]|nr:MAG: lactonase family protein [Alphaproteobacteria bacterium]